VRPQEIQSFSVLFQQNCAGCHGKDGKLGPAPPLNDPLFRALVPDAELQRVVSEGRPGTLMPAFAIAAGGWLTAKQVKILAEGIKQEQHWGPAGPIPSGAPSYLATQRKPQPIPAEAGEPEVIRAPPRPAGPAKPEGAGNQEEGVKVFARACASCHGDHGQGGRYGGHADGRSIGAINDLSFLALISDQALRRYVITGRPDLGMPDYRDPKGRPEGFQPLTPQEVTDVVALLASWRQGGSVKEKGK
jgi:cytochrome c oxidase cbb3-type subunit 3/ubiquinol-cytochrome c reductase cytochrome c subunit